MKNTNVDLNPSGVVGVGGMKNPNDMSVFDCSPGHYPFKDSYGRSKSKTSVSKSPAPDMGKISKMINSKNEMY